MLHHSTHRTSITLTASIVALFTLSACEPEDVDEGLDSDTSDTTGAIGTSQGGSESSDTAAAHDSVEDDYDERICPLEDPVPLGPSLLDAGTCVMQHTGVAVAECRPAFTAYRPCDEAFLSWCNLNGGDVIACDPDEDPRVAPECGHSPFLRACDQQFVDACDAVNANVVCYDDECIFGRCTDILESKYCCESVTDTGTSLVGTGCKAVGNVGANICKKIVLNCGTGVCQDGDCACSK